MVSHPKLGSDPPIGSDRESGCDKNDIHYFTLIRYSVSYQITIRLPRPIIRNE